jgi:hypothetical protein
MYSIFSLRFYLVTNDFSKNIIQYYDRRGVARVSCYVVFDQTTSQVLWKTPRVLKECQHGFHFYKVTLKLYQN